MKVFDRVKWRAVTALTLVALTVSGCDLGADAPGKKSAPGPSVIAPGRPGEPARTLSVEDAAKKAPNDSPNAADFEYVQMMITHHGQALQMTELAAHQAKSGSVKRIASRIAAGQGPEIGAMKGWLQNHGRARHGGAGSGHHHDHAAMPGMATEAQLKQLRAARGAAFDELFLKLMITHHNGAITMATSVLSEGNNVQVEEMANEVITQQTSEIGRMSEMS
ncbi:DUF305 domain-containing protein [Streptomyces colonosanans]|uniref:DUF305 domain-containing protein n=1 Tax=Streptomyces colonosanans TaxID=1428652 RepID=A0A1S2PI79_9ACTN|nr:DUF305 domain-containing protein [Streptomyces colonosanans]OIJ93256.1 DUF305 domain-containing protein [Streptomyces colonosanans]